MNHRETDYLVIGSGAVGLAVADTLLAETAADITIVDRHGRPGGHWNDAYAFVALHQPSAFYGVNGVALGSGRVDERGLNAGFHELATGAEVCSYFEQVVQRHLLPSGRVRHLPMCEVADVATAAAPGTVEIRSLLSGERQSIGVRKRVVDATYYGTTVPATHKPAFGVGPGVHLVPPNALPGLWQRDGAAPEQFVIVGAGKTAMDVGVWLQQCGTPPERITWVMPRDSWLIDRRVTQPGMAFFEHSIGGQLLLMESLVQAGSLDDLFDRLEAGGYLHRIDASVRPSMFHYATLAQAEAAILRRIRNVLRHGRVQAIEAGAMVFADGARVAVPEGSLFIDCSASAVERRPTVPIFQPGRIVAQMVRIPQPAFSAALVAHLEARGASDAEANALAAPIPLPATLAGFPRATLVGLMNQQRWGADAELRQWIRDCRLDGFGRLVAAVDPADAPKIELLTRMKAAGKALPLAAPRWFALAG